MNPILQAMETAAIIIASCTALPQADVAARKAELMAMDHEKLVDMLLAAQKTTTVKVEDVAKMLLEHDDCSWLTYEQIADLIVEAMNSKTSSKSIASYVSKNDWNVVPRKSNKERMTASLALLKG